MQYREVDIANAKILLQRLHDMVTQYGGRNYSLGISDMIDGLSHPDQAAADRMAYARITFKSMMGGMGTLGDFVTWHPDDQIRAALNREMTELTGNLWKMLGC